MRVGIIDLLHDRVRDQQFDPYGYYFRKQFMGIAPQAVAVWCRQLGHRVYYNTYWGQADPLSLLPDDLDIIFVSAFTQASALAYAIAIAFRLRGTRTVLGGPHARSFPMDSTRFFDIVVQNCDRELIGDILRGRVDPPAIVSSTRLPKEFPSVEERMPEIRIASFYNGSPGPASFVPLLASIGCPYSCNFCVDWNSKYVTFQPEALYADLDFLSRNYPKLMVGYHDPNFAVRFDSTMNTIQRIAVECRNPYVMESSLSILKESRLCRLAETNCVFVAPGIESWTDYGNKSGTGQHFGRNKLESVISQLELIRQYVPGIQVNLMFGVDSDEGSSPIALTDEFMRRTPDIWPSINIPTAYGGTPLYDCLYRDKRILETMPFSLYYGPYLSMIIKNYDAFNFYNSLVALNKTKVSIEMLFRRLTSRVNSSIKFVNAVRSLASRFELRELQCIRAMLSSDFQFRAFHEGRSRVLPAFYASRLERRLGRYADLLPAEAHCPILDPPVRILSQ